jgi:hypothetical protein
MEQQMVSPAVPDSEKVDKIAQVTYGMKVYDRAGKKIGHVNGMFGGARGESLLPVGVVVATAAPVPLTGQQTVPLVEPVLAPAKVPVFDDVFDADDSLARELRERLEHDGFIRIDAGFLKHHRYALRDQIERAAHGVVTLNVLADNLIKH